MRRNITWLSVTVGLVALLIGYQLAYAGARSGDGDKGRACPTATTASTADPTATHCEPPGGDRTGDTSTHTGRPGENK